MRLPGPFAGPARSYRAGIVPLLSSASRATFARLLLTLVMTASVLLPVRATFRAVAATVVPETAALDESAWRAVELVVERQLASRPEPVRRQVGLFLRLVEATPVFRFGRRFSRLDAERRHRFLHALERSPVVLLRRGLWGVRTLVFMGYYSQPEMQVSLGYRAHPDGWWARRRVTSLGESEPPVVRE